LFWDKQNADGYDPTLQSTDFEFYNYYAEKVHKSRVMRLKGLLAPSFIRPRLRGWGFSVVEILIRSINQYLKATDVAFEILDEAKIDVYKIKNLVNTLLNPNAQNIIQNRVQQANQTKNYQNAIVMDSEDDYAQKQLSFSGLAETMQQIRMQVAADMRMPITKLFGTSASAGIGNTDQHDMENYNSMVESQVRNKLKWDILRMLEIKCQKLFGMIPDDLEIKFKPLAVLTAEQEENVKNSQFNRLFQLRQAGEIDQPIFFDAINKQNLVGVQLEASDSLMNPDDPSAGEEAEENNGEELI
jgi:phage-related protein (TIGR01555 family)